MGVPTPVETPVYDMGPASKLASGDLDASKNGSTSDPEGQEWLTKDDAALEGLGYRPELKRNFSSLETFGVAFSIMGVVPSIASTIFYNLPYGGPVGMIWGWLLSSILIMFIGLAMADLASSMPTSGGLYYWTYKLAPRKYAPFLSWLVGCEYHSSHCGMLVRSPNRFARSIDFAKTRHGNLEPPEAENALALSGGPQIAGRITRMRAELKASMSPARPLMLRAHALHGRIAAARSALEHARDCGQCTM